MPKQNAKICPHFSGRRNQIVKIRIYAEKKTPKEGLFVGRLAKIDPFCWDRAIDPFCWDTLYKVHGVAWCSFKDHGVS